MDGNNPADALRAAPAGSSTTQPAAAATPLWREEGTNVVRVPFGVRRARRRRPERPDHWATLVIPFSLGGGPSPTPPQAA